MGTNEKQKNKQKNQQISDLRWNTHISNICHICTKANRTLGFLRRTLFSYPQVVKENGASSPVLGEYGTLIPITFRKNKKRFKIVRQGL